MTAKKKKNQDLFDFMQDHEDDTVPVHSEGQQLRFKNIQQETDVNQNKFKKSYHSTEHQEYSDETYITGPEGITSEVWGGDVENNEGVIRIKADQDLDEEKVRHLIKRLSQLSDVKQIVIEREKVSDNTKIKLNTRPESYEKREQSQSSLNEKAALMDKVSHQKSQQPAKVLSFKENPKSKSEATPQSDISNNAHSKLENYIKTQENSEGKGFAKRKVEKSTERVAFDTEGKGYKNKYFYKVKSHQKLYQIGMKYYADYRIGIKHFAFSGKDVQKSKQKSILAIASFLQYQANIKPLIVSLGVDNTFFHDIRINSLKEGTYVQKKDKSLTVYKYEGLSIVDLKDLIYQHKKLEGHLYEESIKKLTEFFDIILWDVPDLSVFEKNKELYFPIYMLFEKVSLIVSKNNKIDEIEGLIDFYSMYGINIKGILFSEDD